MCSPSGSSSAHLVDVFPPWHSLVSRAGEGPVQLGTAVLRTARVRLEGGALGQRARRVVGKAEAESLPESRLTPLNHSGRLQCQPQLGIKVPSADVTEENHYQPLASSSQGGDHPRSEVVPAPFLLQE